MVNTGNSFAARVWPNPTGTSTSGTRNHTARSRQRSNRSDQPDPAADTPDRAPPPGHSTCASAITVAIVGNESC
jgi:hypothetical protein